MAPAFPNPGNTPTTVPKNTPIKQYHRFVREIAVANPSARFEKNDAEDSMLSDPKEG